MKHNHEYVFFYTKHDYPSQHSPHGFNFKGFHFKSCEHWMMFHKNRVCALGEKATMEDVIAFIENDKAKRGPKGHPTLFERIIDANTPQQAKMLGRDVKPYSDSVWHKHRSSVVYYGNLLKFRQNESIRNELIKHAGKTFVEASAKDRIWGIGIGIDSIDINNPPHPSTWRGENLLGKVMDKVAIQISKEFTRQQTLEL